MITTDGATVLYPEVILVVVPDTTYVVIGAALAMETRHRRSDATNMTGMNLFS